MTTTFKWMALGAALGFSVAMGVSCGPAKCNAQNCAFGCCDSAGTCQTGSNDSQCGTAGMACMQCTLGQSCQLNRCALGAAGGGNGGGNGGGSQGGGSGGGAQGGGMGGGAQGGGMGGGTGGGTVDPLCSRIDTAATTFFNGRPTCTDGSLTVNPQPNFGAQCTAGLAQCTSTSDRAQLGTLAGCVETAQPCTSGNETTAIQGFLSCFGTFQSSASMGCAGAILSGAGGGGGNTGGGTGGGTPTGGGGGTPTGGGGGVPTGGGGGVPTGGGTGGGVPTGGGGGTTNACTAYAARYSTIMNGRSTCAAGGFQMNAAPSLASQCTSACSGSMDQSLINLALPCLQGVPACTTPNEQSTLLGFNNCVSDSIGGLSSACQSALTTFGPSGTGGGGGGTPVGGGAGGGTPVGGGTGGGTGACAVISTFSTLRGNGVFSTTDNNTIGFGLNSSTDPGDYLQLEIWWPSGTQSLPVTNPNLGATTYFSCPQCAVLKRTCSVASGGTITCVGGEYLGRTGSLTISAAPRGMTGPFTGTISGVTFEEWDLVNDMRIPNGRCVTVNQGSMSLQVSGGQ